MPHAEPCQKCMMLMHTCGADFFIIVIYFCLSDAWLFEMRNKNIVGDFLRLFLTSFYIGMCCDCAIVPLFLSSPFFFLQWEMLGKHGQVLCPSLSQLSVIDQPIYRARREKSAAQAYGGLLGRGKALKGGVEIYI